jgi:nucleoside-diphosphate-sugar epimerase
VRLLVTGCRGYVGFRLQKFLAAQYPGSTIIGASRSPKGHELACRFDHHQAVDKMLSLARPDIIFHCVGSVCPGPWDLLMSAHIQPTVQLLESLRCWPGKMPRIVIVGSAAEYGPGRPKTRFAETANPYPDTLYGVSKSLQTTVAMAYARWGVPVMVARLFNLLAMDAPPAFAVSRVVKILREVPREKTRTVRVGPLDAVRDFVPLDDALRALCLVGLRGKPGEIYNVCSGRGTRMGDLFEALAQGAGVNVRWVSQGRGSSRSSASYSVGDPGKTRREIGWAPKEVGLDAARRMMSTGR